MWSENRLRSLGVVVAGGLLVLGAGCASKHHGGVTMVSEESTAAALPDYNAVLPDGVSLPSGFYPLRDQYDPRNPDDHYNGWPRYIICEADHMVMAYVPSQTLIMGGGPGLNEVPARTIRVNHFYMDITEVTNKQFSKRFSKQFCKPRKKGPYHAYYIPGLNDYHPVRSVSWFEAFAYARSVHRTLPTEAQWEAAARGGDQRIYPWGNDEQSDISRYLCNCRTGRDNYDGYQATAPVMSYAPGVSPFGIFNMAGNVWEWCADWYDPGRYGYPSDEDPPSALERGALPFGDRNYPNPAHKDIRDARVGPPVGAERVIRGGSFTDPIQRCRVDSRAAALPGVHQNNIGFRCVLLLPPDKEETTAVASR